MSCDARPLSRPSPTGKVANVNNTHALARAIDGPVAALPLLASVMRSREDRNGLHQNILMLTGTADLFARWTTTNECCSDRAKKPYVTMS